MPIVWAINSSIRKNKIFCSVCKFLPFVPIFAGFFACMILNPPVHFMPGTTTTTPALFVYKSPSVYKLFTKRALHIALLILTSNKATRKNDQHSSLHGLCENTDSLIVVNQGDSHFSQVCCKNLLFFCHSASIL